MRKYIVFIISFLTVSILFCPAVWGFTASYRQVARGGGLSSEQNMSVKIKDNKVKMEMDIEGRHTVTIIDEEALYSYSPSEKTAVKMANKGALEMNVLSDYGAYLDGLGAQMSGSEKIGPYDCDIYEFTDPRTGMPSKVWLWKAKRFPVKVEVNTPYGVMTTVMADVKIGIDIDDSEFKLPEGIKIVDTGGAITGDSGP